MNLAEMTKSEIIAAFALLGSFLKLGSAESDLRHALVGCNQGIEFLEVVSFSFLYSQDRFPLF